MKSWIHELSESYVAGRKPVRKDLKENYASLNEEQCFGLLSENVLVYLDEQLQNAYGIGIKDLNEEQLNEFLSTIVQGAKKFAKFGRAAALGGALAAAGATGAAKAGNFGFPEKSIEGSSIVGSKGKITSDGLNSGDMGAGPYTSVTTPEGGLITSDGQVVHHPGMDLNRVFPGTESGKGTAVRDEDAGRFQGALSNVANAVRKFSKGQKRYVTGVEQNKKGENVAVSRPR